MSSVIQASFNAGEWSPKLFARVDLTKYRSGAALLQNWYVDYRGGASTRPGTKYILQCYKSSTQVRLIPFQASANVGYVLEFGDGYIRFFFDGSPVLEASTTITAFAAGVFTDNGHGYVNGNWIFVGGNYYIITSATANTFRLTDLFGNAITTNPFTLPTSTARVYTLTSPYLAAELSALKFVQNVSEMVICHPNHPPYLLTLITSANWTILPITIGTTAAIPTGVSGNYSTSLGTAPDVLYSYVVTSIDSSGQESTPSAVALVGPCADIRTTSGTISISWAAAAGAVAYNVYKTSVSYFGVIPPGSIYGYIGSATGTSFIDDNIAADFSETPPIAKNPFVGNGVASVTVTAPGTYTTVPTVNFSGSATITASGSAVLQVQGTPTVGSGGTGYHVGDTVAFSNGVTLTVATLSGSAVATWASATGQGNVSGAGAVVPTNPTAQINTSGGGTGATANLTWGVGSVIVTSPGGGYTTAPTVVFGSGSAAGTAVLSSTAGGNPTVPGFFQQRLVLAAPSVSPQTFFMSQPGSYFNFNVSSIAQPDDSITGTLVSGVLNTIKSMVPQSAGLLMFTDRNSWLINGGSNGSAVSPSALVANAQSFNGVSDVPPIIANFDVLYVQAKGSIVRDSAYNIYANVYTGTDISAVASHLFYGFQVTEWAWAEEPFKVVWAVRNDGVMLTLTFLKEQEFIGWSHQVTSGNFKSVATVVENTPTAGEVDAIYTVVQRTVAGQTLQYIERVVERTFPNGVRSAWCVDCGIQYSGAPATSFSGAEFLAGLTVTGLADGVIIPSFVMPATGAFTLPTSASTVTIGLPFTCDLQTLPLEMGDPTIQGKVKQITDVNALVADTLGLSCGTDFTQLVPMKDLIVGNVSSMLTGLSNQVVTDLVSGQAKTYINPSNNVPGQVAIRQSLPLPASVLGVVLDVDVGDNYGARK